MPSCGFIGPTFATAPLNGYLCPAIFKDACKGHVGLSNFEGTNGCGGATKMRVRDYGPPEDNQLKLSV